MDEPRLMQDPSQLTDTTALEWLTSELIETLQEEFENAEWLAEQWPHKADQKRIIKAAKGLRKILEIMRG